MEKESVVARHPRWRVLVFPGGMENGIEIYRSLRYCKEVALFSASAEVPNQAFYLYRCNHICPDVRMPGWEEELCRIVRENAIDIIFPANSLVIDALAAAKHRIACDMLIPDDSVLQVTRSKKVTYKRLMGVVPLPEVYDTEEAIGHFPVFAKPDNGYGSQGARVLTSPDDLRTVDFEKMVVQEYLPGREYTVDCLSDAEGKLVFSSGRERIRIRMGTSMHAQAVSEALESLFCSYARAILSQIPIKGAWFFQMKEDREGVLRLLEIDVRIAGTMCYNRCRGINFPLLSLYIHYGLPISVMTNHVDLSLDRSLQNRYILQYEYDQVYVDLDDTLIFRGEVNTDLVKFIFQCLNKNKQVILISKHLGEKNEVLNKYRIGQLFSRIIWLEEEDAKYRYMQGEKSIYIDDSYSQRAEVALRLNIPTFDSSMIECLFDERI